MLPTGGGFVAICPKKEVELGADRLIHRADHAAELKAEIEFACAKAVSNQYACLAGGALRAINPNSSMTMAEADTCAAVFKGNLSNKGELALQLVGCPPHLSEAELLLRLYAASGLDMLGRLQGQYAFCLYDSKQARVLAARDHSGAVPLLEGRTAAGSLIIACGTYLPDGCMQMVEIQPGEYKYGWHALPRAFKSGGHIVSGRASCDYGIRRRSVDAFNAPQVPHRQGSLDIPARSHVPHSGSSAGTPGRYVPPRGAAAFASGRPRTMSLDGGHWGPPPTSLSSSLPSPQSPHLPYGGGRRRSETTSHPATPTAGGGGGGGSASRPHPQQPQPAPQTFQAAHVPAAASAHGHMGAAPHAAAAAKAAAAALATAAAAASATALAPAAGGGSSSKAGAPAAVVVPAPASSPASPGSKQQGGDDGAAAEAEAETPHSATSDGSSPHRRKRRHRSRRHKGSTGSAAAGADGAGSDTESQVSTSTHDSTHSGGAAAGKPGAPAKAAAPPAAAAAAGDKKGPPAATAAVAGGAAAAGHKAANGHAHANGSSHAHQHAKGHSAHAAQHKAQQHPHQQWQPKQPQQAGEPQPQPQRRSSSGSGGGTSGGGVRRSGSCGELAAMGTSPTAAAGHSVLLAAPQGLAC